MTHDRGYDYDYDDDDDIDRWGQLLPTRKKRGRRQEEEEEEPPAVGASEERTTRRMDRLGRENAVTSMPARTCHCLLRSFDAREQTRTHQASIEQSSESSA